MGFHHQEVLSVRRNVVRFAPGVASRVDENGKNPSSLLSGDQKGNCTPSAERIMRGPSARSSCFTLNPSELLRPQPRPVPSTFFGPKGIRGERGCVLESAAANPCADSRVSLEEPDTPVGAVLLVAVPIILQVYFNSGLTYLLMRWFRVEHGVAAPGALIGASNFFELAVAVPITLFGADSPAALATVVGVLIEVPVMLSVCNLCNRKPG